MPTLIPSPTTPADEQATASSLADARGPDPQDPQQDPDSASWRRRQPGPDELRSDYLLAGGLLIAALLSLALWQVAGLYEDPAPGWLSVLCLVGVTGPLALRRRFPSAVAVVVAVAFIVLASTRVPETLVANISLFLSLYTVGAWEPDRPRATWVRLTIIVAMFVFLLISLFVATSDPEGIGELSRAGAFSPLVAFLLIQLLTNVVYFAAAHWFGNNAWTAARQRERTEARTRELEVERRTVAAQAVSLERLRLARELHDAVAHHVSLMGVQASAARTLLTVDPGRTAAALELVEESAREAIGELEGILSTLRDPESGETRHDALGSLDITRLPDLVADARAAGLPTTFQVIGEPTPLPPLASLNLYRITQEALTNARKHAGPHATADVRLRFLMDAVEIEVTDDGLGGRAAATRRGGLGLIGMRERVQADGGTLEARPRIRGGFLIRARIPLVGRSTPTEDGTTASGTTASGTTASGTTASDDTASDDTAASDD